MAYVSLHIDSEFLGANTNITVILPEKKGGADAGGVLWERQKVQGTVAFPRRARGLYRLDPKDKDRTVCM